MSAGRQVLVSVVIPLFNEEANVEPLYRRLKQSLALLSYQTEILMVDDGSTDGTLSRLRELARRDESLIILRLGKNLGQHRAILEGFLRSEGDVIVTLDGDLQNPPEEIPRLVRNLLSGFDVVAGWRRERSDSHLRLFISGSLNLFASIATGVKMRDYGCMLRAYRREILDAVLRFGRHTPFIPTLVTSMGARACEVVVGHERRTRGRSKYGITRLIFLYANLLLDFFHVRMGFRAHGAGGKARGVAFFGYGPVGCECLAALLEMKQRITCVVTHADDPGERIWFPSVMELARENGISVIAPADVRDPSLARALKKQRPDLILSVFYRQILPRELLAIPRRGAVNIHPSLLPKYRGRAPLNWAIIEGEKKTGVTLHYMSEKADTGDIIDQIEFEIAPGDTIATLYEKAVAASRKILESNLMAVLGGNARRTPQNEELATRFGRRTPEDGRIDWMAPAGKIRDLVRGVTHPFPGAFSSIRGERLYIWQVSVLDREGEPGIILDALNGSFAVGTGKGAVVIERAQNEGGPELSGREIMRALGLEGGDRFDVRA
jgi:methionyl-tRNA formyltransferase